MRRRLGEEPVQHPVQPAHLETGRRCQRQRESERPCPHGGEIRQVGDQRSATDHAWRCDGPTKVDTLDRGGLYCMPQPEARIGWGIKRFTPTVYTRAAGLTNRVTT